jgi:peptidoglycan/xylan/chitin deacetylase (PgdA/CDA1 family)
MSETNKRDLAGYGKEGPQVGWPNQARVAISFVINYEEGAELTPVNGDAHAEVYGGEFPLTIKDAGVRNLGMESLFEYGSRAGIWRLLRLFDGASIPVTFFATGFALTCNPDFCDYLKTSTHEIAGHGWRWIDYANMPREHEKKHIIQCINLIEKTSGTRPVGWYTGRRSPNTRDLLLEIGGFLYDSEAYSDDYPFYEGKHLVLPYSLDCNDFRFSTTPGFSSPEDFYHQLKSSFDYLYQENRSCMMSIGLHPRFAGHPGRCQALARFIDHIQQFPDIWLARRADIAEYWLDATK